MKVNILKKVEVEAKTLQVKAGVRYWEDATVNDVEDNDGELIPCRIKDDNENWFPVIDIDSGIITNWEKGKTAEIHYKVCDDGIYVVFDENEKEIARKEGYVPDTMSPKEQGYGDYIIMNVDENGLIENWKFDINDFICDED